MDKDCTSCTKKDVCKYMDDFQSARKEIKNIEGRYQDIVIASVDCAKYYCAPYTPRG